MNKIIAGARVSVENTIAGVKRCRIVKDIFPLLSANLRASFALD